MRDRARLRCPKSAAWQRADVALIDYGIPDALGHYDAALEYLDHQPGSNYTREAVRPGPANVAASNARRADHHQPRQVLRARRTAITVLFDRKRTLNDEIPCGSTTVLSVTQLRSTVDADSLGRVSDEVAASRVEIHATADRVHGLADTFADDIDGLMRQARSVIGAEWLGDAANSHQSVWQDWEADVRRIVAALYEDAMVLHQVAERFGATDEGNANAMDGLGLDLP
ncbi:WXG100 family type VII secretion target [Nocardia sp. NPDC057440]|uniref:WXG100 family type VII secretion target n=1 Tax=Nocardia sp. NPDC057440 TaxID=3346134 RepID=UPI00366D7AC7